MDESPERENEATGEKLVVSEGEGTAIEEDECEAIVQEVVVEQEEGTQNREARRQGRRRKRGRGVVGCSLENVLAVIEPEEFARTIERPGY